MRSEPQRRLLRAAIRSLALVALSIAAGAGGVGARGLGRVAPAASLCWQRALTP